eukprot:scaffold21733_cov53-Attheya_sp.AAC.1
MKIDDFKEKINKPRAPNKIQLCQGVKNTPFMEGQSQNRTRTSKPAKNGHRTTWTECNNQPSSYSE